MTRALALAAGVAVAASASSVAPVLADAPAAARIDLDAVRGLLAVQRLDGWLLYDYRGQNRVAANLIGPRGEPQQRWFYFIPAKGPPVLIVHEADAALFAGVPGRAIRYEGWRALDAGLAEALRGASTVAMEYSEQAEIPALSRVDAGTLERVRARTGASVVSSAQLVQYASSVWGAVGLSSHHLAAHHLDRLRRDAFAFIAAELAAGRRVTEYDVQQRIARGMQVRGMAPTQAIVATGAHAAEPGYVPAKGTAAPIRRGELVVVELWGRMADEPRAVHANIAWVGYVGTRVPKRFRRPFAAVVRARDAALELIRQRVARRRPIKGYEADQVARRVLTDAGFGDAIAHRTGHSIDTQLHGNGADLDDYEIRDTRSLMFGSGFTIEPGIYVRGAYGMRSGVDVYIGRTGAVVTTAAQTEIVPILAP